MAPRPWAVVFVGAVLTLGSTAPASAAEDLFAALGAERLVTPRAAPDLALPSLDSGMVRLKDLLQEGTSERLQRRRIVVGQETSTASAPVPVATILGAPEAFEGRQGTGRGTGGKAEGEVFPHGKPYHTLSVGVGETVLTVFSWSPPSAKAGDRVEAMGVFHVWRYNIRHMIDAAQIRRLEPVR